jgi:hypothetical protein
MEYIVSKISMEGTGSSGETIYTYILGWEREIGHLETSYRPQDRKLYKDNVKI